MSKKQGYRNAGKHKQASTKTSAPSEGNLSPTKCHQVSEDSDKQDTNSTTSGPVNTNNGVIGFYSYVYKLSKTGHQYVLKKLPLIIPSIILLLLGFKQWPQNDPILNFASEHRGASPIIGGGLSLLF